MIDCPCYSKKKYLDCCKPLHMGAHAENALLLMRSRYAAYALELADYIIKTTHSSSPYFMVDKVQWIHEIIDYCENKNFEDLSILEYTPNAFQETVTFKAVISCKGEDVSFTEKSLFQRENGEIKYLQGIHL